MKMYKKPGFNRLAKSIGFLGCILTYVTLIVTTYRVSDEEAFIAFPIVSVIGGLIAFLSTRLVYWVIDGFNVPKDEGI